MEDISKKKFLKYSNYLYFVVAILSLIAYFTKKDMVNLLNNRVKRGELTNTSIVLNGFENKAKYGATYGYGYGNYSNGYHEETKKESLLKTIFNKLNKK